MAWRLEVQQPYGAASIGREVAVGRHMQDDEEFTRPIAELNIDTASCCSANWTGTGRRRPAAHQGHRQGVDEPEAPLTGAREFNRISGPDANSCAGCHNAPYGIAGGGGDFVTNVFVLGQRFDFATFDPRDTKPTRGAPTRRTTCDASDRAPTPRATPGMFGAGYLEMLARQMTDDLQTIRDTIRPGQSRRWSRRVCPFGTLTRRVDGTWDTPGGRGLARAEPGGADADRPAQPDRPAVASGGQRRVAARVHEQRLQPSSRHPDDRAVRRDTDPDGDGVMNEMTRGDVTAVAMFQATLAVPGRVIPNNPEVERAVLTGEAGLQRSRVRDLPRAGAAARDERVDLFGAESVQSADEPAPGNARAVGRSERPRAAAAATGAVARRSDGHRCSGLHRLEAARHHATRATPSSGNRST